uniref:SAM domain-containing protein n=1 Tax=Strigamia maritima TaxID=126957 RepID=T1JEV9_STRMM
PDLREDDIHAADPAVGAEVAVRGEIFLCTKSRYDNRITMTSTATINPLVEASDMLAAAIEQMDGIIAKTSPTTPTYMEERPLCELLEQVRHAIESGGGIEWESIKPDTREFFLRLNNGKTVVTTADYSIIMKRGDDKKLVLSQQDSSGEDKLTFVVTIKPSPPSRRKFTKPTPSSPPSDKSFSEALQELIEQITAPAERELEEQLRPTKQAKPRPQPSPQQAKINRLNDDVSRDYKWNKDKVEDRPSGFDGVNSKNRWRSPTKEIWQNGIHDKCKDISLDQNEWMDKIRRLENDKSTLGLQVSVLMEQVEAQNEKIRDVEVVLEHERKKALKMEEMMQQEMKLRSSMENQKLDFMSEMSRLKLCLSNLENDKFELEKKLFKSESELAKFQRNFDHSSSFYLRGRKTPTQETNVEVEKMKKALESVMAANDEKDRKIDDLRAAMSRYKRIQEKMIEKRSDDEHTNNDWSPHFANKFISVANDSKLSDKPPLAPPRSLVTSTPIRGDGSLPQTSPVSTSGRRSMSPVVRKSPGINCTHGSEESVAMPVVQSGSAPRSIEHYGTVPRNYAPALAALANSGSSSTLPGNMALLQSSKPSFGKTFFSRARDSSRSTSAPNLAETEVDSEHDGRYGRINMENNKPKTSKGFKKYFGKLKRSNSQSMENEVVPTDFQRGGLRATAGSRLAWSQDIKRSKDLIDVPFARWDAERVMAWLHDLGLSAYISECKRWVRNGDQLLKATVDDLEKELGIKNSLHRKKLSLALQAKGSEDPDIYANLDYHWVMRWLDDVGLPQYKDVFSDGRVDGRMLNRLTISDLSHLRVTSLLHAISLKQGIYVLRLHGFSPLILKRRSAPDESKTPPPSDVALWTNHRVMEWLRSVDLSEYAPNLRGSGVHGAVMVYDERFNAELLATLLSIPPTKTLLRRHLSMHFTDLVGPQVMQQKRDHESLPTYTALTPHLKVKIVKKNQFSLSRKRSKSEAEDLLCPMDDQNRLKFLISQMSYSNVISRNSPSPVPHAPVKLSPRASREENKRRERTILRFIYGKMRFIQLEKREGKTALDRILKYGCGPNFVLNRKETFECMVKEQGQTFWFRFWLAFCTHPECPLICVERKWPDLFYYCYISLHEHFVEATVEDAAEFCWNVIFVQGGRSDNKKKRAKASPLEQLQADIYDAVALNFGIALCEVFYKWLLAKDADDGCRSYWCVPESYMDCCFKPTPLEVYISMYWKDRVLKLLGVSKTQLPWLKKLLEEKHECSDEFAVDVHNVVDGEVPFPSVMLCSYDTPALAEIWKKTEIPSPNVKFNWNCLNEFYALIKYSNLSIDQLYDAANMSTIRTEFSIKKKMHSALLHVNYRYISTPFSICMLLELDGNELNSFAGSSVTIKLHKPQKDVCGQEAPYLLSPVPSMTTPSLKYAIAQTSGTKMGLWFGKTKYTFVNSPLHHCVDDVTFSKCVSECLINSSAE